MKALTLTQPYATLVALGAKQIETRGRGFSHRGPLAIHAGLGPGYFGSEAALWDCCLSPPFAHVLREAGLPSPAACLRRDRGDRQRDGLPYHRPRAERRCDDHG